MASTYSAGEDINSSHFSQEVGVLICPIQSASSHFIAIAPCPMVITGGYFIATVVANSTQTATLAVGNDNAAAASLDLTLASSFAVGSGATAGTPIVLTIDATKNKLLQGEPIAIKFSATATSLVGVIALRYHCPKKV